MRRRGVANRSARRHAARGPPAAREAVLPAVARGGGPGAHRGAAADEPRTRPAPAGGARLTPTRRRALRHLRGAHRRGVPARGAPAHAAAGPAASPRRRPGPRPRPARLPAGVRRARRHPVVPAAAARRGCRGASGWPVLGTSRIRGRPAGPGAGGAAAAGRRRRSWPRREPAEVATSLRAAACRHRRPGRRGDGRPGAAPLRAVADRLRRPARTARRRRGVRALSSVWRRGTGGGPRRRACARRSTAGGPTPARFAVIAMGRLGGAELGYGSDADVLFVFEPLRGRRRDRRGAFRLVSRRVGAQPAWLTQPRSTAGHRRRAASGGTLTARWSAPWRRTQSYYTQWAPTWEAQALLRASPVAGDAGAGGAVHRDDRPGALPAPAG